MKNASKGFTLDRILLSTTCNSLNCKRLQGAADARWRTRRRTHVLQVPANAAGAVPCERLPKGFTLLEIIVSISIIAIVFVSLFKMQARNITLSEAEYFYSTAPYLAQKIIADIETDFTDTSDTSDESGEFKDEFKNYRWSYSITSGYEPLDSDVMNGEKIENFKKIDLEISKNHDYSITFQTWRYIQK